MKTTRRNVLALSATYWRNVAADATEEHARERATRNAESIEAKLCATETVRVSKLSPTVVVFLRNDLAADSVAADQGAPSPRYGRTFIETERRVLEVLISHLLDACAEDHVGFTAETEAQREFAAMGFERMIDAAARKIEAAL